MALDFPNSPTIGQAYGNYEWSGTTWIAKTITGDTINSVVHAAISKTTPVDADETLLVDSAAAWVTKKLTWSNIKATLLSTWKDTTGGLAGLTLFKINFRNAADTFTSFLTNSNTAARTYTFQDRDGTIADNTDLGTKADLAGNVAQSFSMTTAAADTNTTQGATTAFVLGQAGSSNPMMDGTAAVGTSLRYSRQDHVHPTDTSRAPTANPTFTGTVTNDASIVEVPVVANTGTTYAITIASLHNLTLTGNCTFSFPTATAGRQFTLILNQDATGSRTVTWPGSVRWAGSTTPTITSTASKTDVLSFICDGTYWLGFVGGQVFTRA